MPFNYMSRNLTLNSLPSGLWKLGEEVIYENGVIEIIVPKGTKTDLASIPDGLKWFISNDDRRIIRPAICHDFLYSKQHVANRFFSREEADLLFYEMLRVEGMHWFKARMMYYAVRLGGWMAWDND